MRGRCGTTSGRVAVLLIAALPTLAWAAGGPLEARSPAPRRWRQPGRDHSLGSSTAPGHSLSGHRTALAVPGARGEATVPGRRTPTRQVGATLPNNARRAHEPTASQSIAAPAAHRAPVAASRPGSGIGIARAAGKVGTAAVDGVVSGADVVSRLFGSATTRHTAFRRWVQRNAKTFATRARVKLTYLPLTLLMKTFEINEGGLFINGVLYTLDGAARVGAGGLKLVARESFRYGTMSRALRRVDRATRKGDFGEASEALAEMEREGSSPEADRARRLVLRRAVRGLKGPADAPRTAEELAQLKAENLERARAVLAGLPARERGALEDRGRLRATRGDDKGARSGLQLGK